MEATTLRRAFVLRLSATLLAGLIAAVAVPVWAEDDDDESSIGMDALAGLTADEGGGDIPDSAGTGDANDPPAGASTGPSDDARADVAPGSDRGTANDSDPTSPAAYATNPMFKLMAGLIVSEVQAAEAEAAKTGTSLTEAERVAVAKGAARDLVTFMQEAGLLDEEASGDAEGNALLQQIEGIATEPQGPPSTSSETDDD